MHYTTMNSPLGELVLIGEGEALIEVNFPTTDRHGRTRHLDLQRDDAALARAKQQLQEYFAGTRSEFDLPLAPRGTEFQQSVWQALRRIPFGQTRSYAAIANSIGKPKAMRAVGMANGRNPIPIIIPCHRVIGANGALVGFSGGLQIKQQLLALERAEATAALF